MTQLTDENVIWLTQEAYDRLKAELEHLTGPVRAELSRRIGEARDEGDLKENGGYHAAKEEQGKTEAQIRKLQDMLRRVRVGDTPADDGVVEPGMKVTIRFKGDDDTETFILGSRELLPSTTRSTSRSTHPSRRSVSRSAASARATRPPTPHPTARR